MSGIAGIVCAASRLVNERLLERMAASMQYRAPDGCGTWSAGDVGFAHASFRTSNAPEARQPTTSDGSTWITADARIDGRADLVRKLEAAGRAPVLPGDDAQLILHAYAVWGSGCIEHLIGDFAFAIWDGRERRLFCARDHFGVKPFFYAEVDGGIVFSNTLDCVRLHPAVGDSLNELSMADFLLFGYQQDPTATAFAKIKRLAPAHTLSFERGAATVRRYWSLPAGTRIRYRKSTEYVDHFSQLLRMAVDDRVGDGETAVWMSGGLDSTAIAATAQQIVTARGSSPDLRAYTVVYQSLFDDREGKYADVAARAIGISTRHLVADTCLPFDGWDDSAIQTPEPIDDPYHLLRTTQLKEVAARSRVALSGDGGDEVFWRSYVVDLFGALPLRELAVDLARSLVVHHRRPAIGLRARLDQWLGRDQRQATMPVWLNVEMASRHDLAQRFADAGKRRDGAPRSVRAEARRRLSSPYLHSFLEGHDPGVTRVALEHRWPFLDVRLVSYLLAIPPVPWCIDKLLARVAMRGSLPESIRTRPKTPLAGDPLHTHLQSANLSRFDRFVPAPQLSRFVDRQAVPSVARIRAAADPWIDLRPLCLNYWLLRLDHHAAQRCCHDNHATDSRSQRTQEEAV